MRTSISIITLLFCGLAFNGLRAQSYFGTILSADTTRNVEVNVEGVGFHQASKTRKEFVNYFIKGGEIPTDLINEVYQKQNDVNGFGLSLYGGVNVKMHNWHLGLGTNYGLEFNLATKTIASLAYTKDLYNLAFMGNANALGETLVFNSSSFQLDSYQKVGVGVFNRNTNTFLRLNYVASNFSSNAFMSSGQLYTSANGDTLSLEMDGLLKLTNTDGFYNAHGASVDFEYNMPFGTETDKFKGVISFRITDLGMVYAKNLTYYNVDTSITFSGADVSTIQQLFNTSGTNVLDTLGVDKTSTSELRFLPSVLEVAKRIELNREDKWQSMFGVRLYPTLVSVPLVYAGAHYRINEKLAAGARLSYGGFGGFRVGTYFRMHSSNFDCYLATQDLAGLISKRGFGNALQLGLAWYF